MDKAKSLPSGNVSFRGRAAAGFTATENEGMLVQKREKEAIKGMKYDFFALFCGISLSFYLLFNVILCKEQLKM